MGDVIELTHPKPGDEQQSDLFRYLLDRRHHPNELTISDRLSKVRGRAELEAIEPHERRSAMRDGALEAAGVTWEWLAGWLPGGMDAEAWEHVIPSMGYMALLRNLRNFDQAGISRATQMAVASTLADPEAVARSRQFPYRFWSAYKNVPSLTWASALEEALDASVSNIPTLAGRTLVLTDTSASMTYPVSGRAKIAHFEIAALFAAAVARQGRRAGPDLVRNSIGADPVPCIPVGCCEPSRRWSRVLAVSVTAPTWAGPSASTTAVMTV